MKKVSLLLALAMLIAVIAACAPAAPAAPAEPAAPAAPAAAAATDIEFWTFQDLHVEFYEKMVAKWNAANPNEQINFIPTVYPFEDMHSKLLIAFQSGTGAPDLVDIEIGKFPNFLRGDISLAPLNDVVEPELPNIVRARVDIYSKDGNFYGICFHIGAAVMFYNTELCEQAGVDYTAIKTWDDYYAAGQKLKAAAPDKYWASVEAGDVWHFWPLVRELGGDMVTADATPSIASPEFAQALEYNRKLINEGIATIAPGADANHHTEEFYQIMDAGQVASISMPMWYLDRFTDHMPSLAGKMAVSPLPFWQEGQQRSSVMGGTGTAVTNQAENVDLTKRFLAYAKLSRDGNIEIWNTLGFDPIRIDVWELPEVKDAVNKFTDYYVNSPFDVLTQITNEIQAVNVNEALPATLDAMKNNVFSRAYRTADDIPAMLAEEQEQISY